MRGNFVDSFSKSFILNGFKSQFFGGSNLFFGEATYGLFFFLCGQNLLKWNLNLLSFSVQYFFDLAAPHWHCLYRREGFIKPIQTTTSARDIVAAITWLHVSPIPAIHVQWQILIFAVFLIIIQSFWNGSFIDWDFLHSPLMIQHLLPERLWYCKGWNYPDLQ